MPYKISGNVDQASRLVILENDGTFVTSTDVSGDYEIEGLVDNNEKIVLARRTSDGESLGYSNVTPIYYDNTPQNLDITLITGADDGHMYTDNGTFEATTATGMNLAAGSTSRTCVAWWRFRNINIPQGSTINSAYIVATWNATNAYTFNTAIRVENTDNAAQFTAAANYGQRSWLYITNITGTSTAGQTYQTPSLVSGVQAIVNRAGWSAGNSMQFTTGPYVNSRLWRWHTSEGGYPAHLYITYVAP